MRVRWLLLSALLILTIGFSTGCRQSADKPLPMDQNRAAADRGVHNRSGQEPTERRTKRRDDTSGNRRTARPIATRPTGIRIGKAAIAPKFPQAAFEEAVRYEKLHMLVSRRARQLFLASFTADQKRHMAGGQWLRYADLTANQKRLARLARRAYQNETASCLLALKSDQLVRDWFKAAYVRMSPWGPYVEGIDRAFNDIPDAHAQIRVALQLKGNISGEEPGEPPYKAIQALRTYAEQCKAASAHYRSQLSFNRQQKAKLDAGGHITFWELSSRQRNAIVNAELWRQRSRLASSLAGQVEALGKPPPELPRRPDDQPIFRFVKRGGKQWLETSTPAMQAELRR